MTGSACSGWRGPRRIETVKILLPALLCAGVVGALTTAGSAPAPRPDVFHMPAGLRSLETVAVGNPGNPADDTGFGAVSRPFRMGKFEVTAAQYVAFLNAKAKSDPDGNLWNNDMDTTVSGPGPRCGIRREGESGNYTYSVPRESANRPVNFVSYWDACRFCNWLHNGQRDGDTEDGAYTLHGYRGRNGRMIRRNPGARWFLPNEDEWYKAAYHDPGNPGGSGYWDYPTRSDAKPNRDFASANAANHADGGLLDPDRVFTEAGAFAQSPSAYGTFDQAGNVSEWVETSSQWDGTASPSLRWARGGSAASSDAGRNVRTTDRSLFYDTDSAFVGFRVACAVPGISADAQAPAPPRRPARVATANRMVGRTFLLTQDSRDICYQAPPGKAQDWIRSWYRRAFAAGVTVFVADVATPDVVVTKDSPTGEIWGGRADVGQEEEKLDSRYRTIKELARQGTDVLHLLSEEGRRAKALVLAGMRMGDAHHGTQWQPAAQKLNFPEFALQNPQWCNTWVDGKRDVTLNYAVPEVQAHRLQILRELATNYDIDGIELDWMRHCRYFPAGRQREYLKVMTRFVGQVRAMLDEVAQKKGVARMVLGHRVPATLEEGLNIGLDVKTWATSEFADYVVPMDFQHVDPNVRTDEFVRAVQGTQCRVYPSFGNTPYSNAEVYGEGTPKSPRRRSRVSTLEQYRALAANWFAWGAHGGASYNIIAWPPERQEFATKAVSILAGDQKAMLGPRHYLFLPTWKVGGGILGRFNAQSLVFSEGNDNRRQVFHFRMADGKDGRKLRGWLRLRVFDASPGDVFALDVNGIPVPDGRVRVEYFPDGERSKQPVRPFKTSGNFGVPEDGTFDWPQNLRLEIPLEHCPPLRGDNEIGVTLVKKSPDNPKTRVLETVEVMVR